MYILFSIFIIICAIVLMYLLYRAEKKRIEEEIKMLDELKELSNKLREQAEALKKSLGI